MTPWAELSAEAQMKLREEYNASPDCLTGTCSLEAKMQRFTDWLAERGVAFSEADLHPARKG